MGTICTIKVMKICMILAPQEFRDEEYMIPRGVFESRNEKVITASTSEFAVGRFGLQVEIDMLLLDVSAQDFDAVFWVGGLGCLKFLEQKEAMRIAREFQQEQKVIGAICAAPRLLLHWNILQGKNMTGWNGDRKLGDLAQQFGATYTGNDVETDGNILTADGPDSSQKAGKQLLKMLS